MKLKTLVLSMILVCALLLSACGGTQPKPETDIPKTPAVTATVAPATPKPVKLADFYGCWEYYSSDEWICIYKGGTYEYITENGVSSGLYDYVLEDDCLILPDGLQMQICLYPQENGDLKDGNGNELFLSELPQFAYFESEGIYSNYEPGDGPFEVPNGLAYYREDGSAYIRTTAVWEADIISDQNTGDGFRELEFSATLRLLDEYNPNLAGQYMSGACQ